MKRNIIEISEEKCNGCGECIPNCPEGALQIIDNKARLVSDLFCDGLGACIGHCPQGAINVVEREAEPYDERKVMENIVKHGENTIKAHLEHLKSHGEEKLLNQAEEFLKEKGIENPLVKEAKAKAPARAVGCSCPSTKVMEFKDAPLVSKAGRQKAELRQWPVQLMLVPPNAPYFDNSELLVCADCVPFAHPNFHNDLLKGKSLVVGCPKLDDVKFYAEKLTEIIKANNIKKITVATMEVPCCSSLFAAAEKAVADSGKEVELENTVVSIHGN